MVWRGMVLEAIGRGDWVGARLLYETYVWQFGAFTPSDPCDMSLCVRMALEIGLHYLQTSTEGLFWWCEGPRYSCDLLCEKRIRGLDCWLAVAEAAGRVDEVVDESWRVKSGRSVFISYMLNRLDGAGQLLVGAGGELVRSFGWLRTSLPHPRLTPVAMRGLVDAPLFREELALRFWFGEDLATLVLREDGSFVEVLYEPLGGRDPAVTELLQGMSAKVLADFVTDFYVHLPLLGC